MMKTITLGIWLVNAGLFVCTAWTWNQRHPSATVSVQQATKAQPRMQEVTPTVQPTAIFTEEAPRETFAGSGETAFVTPRMLQFLAKYAPIGSDDGRERFTEKTVNDLGFSQSPVIASTLNQILDHAAALELKYSNMGVNVDNEPTLTVQAPQGTVEILHKEALQSLSQYVPPATAEIIWRLTKRKLRGNLDFQSFSITRHDDVPSGEHQFVITSIEREGEGSEGSGSERHEPVGSSLLQEWYGHLLGAFQESERNPP